MFSLISRRNAHRRREGMALSKLKDIARVAGVSISTVSKALNNSAEIGRETKSRIIQIAQDLQYDMSPAKQSVEKKSGCLISVICPEINSNYYAQLVNSVGANITSRGFQYMVAVSDFSTEKEEAYLEMAAGQGIDGVVLISESENRDIEPIIRNARYRWSKPLVLIANQADTNEFDCIKIDDPLGVITGVEHLIRLGHTRIGYLGDRLTEGRLFAYRKALEQNKITPEDDLVRVSDLRFEECGYLGMKELLASRHLPTAVFAAYDDIAIGAMRAVQEHGLSVPGDISVVGMDNVSACPYLSKGLTTVSNPIREMAAISVSILTKKIRDSEYTVVQHVVLKPELIIRETTSAPA